MSRTLARILKKAEQKVKPGNVYRHYKEPKKYYKVERLAINEADHKVMVVYSTHGGVASAVQITWTRPLDSWLEMIGGERRFTRVE